MDSESKDIKKEETIKRLVNKAVVARNEGKLELSTALFSEAALIDPYNELLADKLHGISYRFGENQNASRLLTLNLIRAIYQDKDISIYPNALFEAGMTLIELGEVIQGEALLREGIDADPGNRDFYRTLGYFLLNQERYKEGISLLEDASDDDEETVDDINVIAWAKFRLGRQDEALEYLLGNFTYDKRVPIFYLQFVQLLDDNSALNALLRMQTRLVELVEEDMFVEQSTSLFYESWLRIINILAKTQHLLKNVSNKEEVIDQFYVSYKENLINQFNELSEKPSLNFETLLGLGNAFLELDENGKALEFSDKASILVPTDPRPLALRANALLAKEDYPAALRSAEEGLRLTENQPTKMVKEEAQDYLAPPSLDTLHTTASQEETDTRAELLLSKIDALTGLEQYDPALETARYAQSQYTQEIIYYRYAAALLLKTGKSEEALRQLRSARKAGVKLDAPSKELQKKIKAALESKG